MKIDLLGQNTKFGLAVLLDSPFCCLWITIISMVIGLLLYGSIHLVSTEEEGLLVEGCDDVGNPPPCTYPLCQEQMHHSVLKSFHGNMVMLGVPAPGRKMIFTGGLDTNSSQGS